MPSSDLLHPRPVLHLILGLLLSAVAGCATVPATSFTAPGRAPSASVCPTGQAMVCRADRLTRPGIPGKLESCGCDDGHGV
jgi:hypothetical protein